MDPESKAQLEAQIAELRMRVQALEAAVRRESVLPANVIGPRTLNPLPPGPVVLTNTGQPVPAPVLLNTVALPETHRGPAAPPPPAPAVNLSGKASNQSLESRIGSQWFNRIGIIAVLIGVSWFLKLAFDNHWIGPLGRVVIGLLAGTGLIAWSERFHRKGFDRFSYSLKAVGSGALYLSLWAAFSLYHLLPSWAAFAAMIAVTAFNGWMCWVQESELLALYSIVGGLSTPLLLSTGQNHETTLLSYLLLLDAAVLVLVLFRPWARLLFGAFTGTVFYFAGWWFTFYSNDQFGRTTVFLACFFTLFAFAPRLLRFRIDAGEEGSRWDKLALIVMPVANAGLTFFCICAMLDQRNATGAAPWIAVLFAAFYLLLLRLPARGPLHPFGPLVAGLQLTTAVVFLTLAIPLKTHGRWLTIGWLVQGAALLWVARRVRLWLLRVLALLCLGLGLFALIALNPAAVATPLLNARFATYCVAIGVFAFVAMLARSTTPEADNEEAPTWASLVPASFLTVNLLILLAVGWEIHGYWWFVRWQGAFAMMHDYRMDAQFTYSAFFMLFGAVLLGLGFWRHSAFVRWQALVLLAVSIGKVFLVDVSTLSQGYRILSFLGLGVLLLGVSFVYQRDWLHLRTPEGGGA